MTGPIPVVVLIVAHNGLHHLPDCLSSVFASNDTNVHRTVVVVDNASTDGSADWMADHYPSVRLIRSPVNVGFARGNNLGLYAVRSALPMTRYVALLNQDTIAQSGWLAGLVQAVEGRPVVGIAQSCIMLHPQTDRFNTVGNVSHILGFGFTTGYGERDAGQYRERRRIGFASGAAMLVRLSALAGQDLFDAEFGAYLEDAELSWRLRQMGYDIIYVPESIVRHKYAFKSDYRNYYELERNRWLLLGTYYKLPTILLLLPALALMEIGQLYFAWSQGVGEAKLRAWRYFTRRGGLGRLMRQRQAALRRRRLPDWKFLQLMTGRVDFPELRHPLLTRLANPLFDGYWRIARRLIFW